MKGKLVIFSAPSGAGKTTIVKEILKIKEFKLQFSVSACSRKKREFEIDGKDYYFVTAENFKNKIKNDEFVEWEEVYKDQFYGTLKSEIDKIRSEGINVVFDIDVIGGLNIKKIYGDYALTIFVMPPSIKELEKRLRNRSTESEESLLKRISKAEKELSRASEFDKIVINDVLESAIDETVMLLKNFF